jgi:hypothetical protein
VKDGVLGRAPLQDHVLNCHFDRREKSNNMKLFEGLDVRFTAQLEITTCSAFS